MGTTRMRHRQGSGPTVFTYEVAPGVPPVGARRLGRDAADWPPGAEHPHAHDFLVLVYFEQDGGSMRLGSREWRLEAGDVYIIAPGEVVGEGIPGDLDQVEGWAVYFPPEVFGPGGQDAFLAWRTHPLLYPFVRGAAGGAQRLQVPPEDRPTWSARMAALDLEIRQRRGGYREAALAHLTLLLVEVGRLAADVVGDLRLKDEPLLAAVFAAIEARYRERISLQDVARAVSLTPGHLTTVVRRKTGRTVQEWIAERRLAEARRLLVETDLAVEEIARQVGYGDPGYFVRSFGRAHGTTPLGWRRAGRP